MISDDTHAVNDEENGSTQGWEIVFPKPIMVPEPTVVPDTEIEFNS